MITTFHHSEFPASRIAAERDLSVSVCLPARDEERTIGPILERLMPLVERGAVDQVVVVDESSDATPEIARGLGAEVHRQSDLHPELGLVQGKGDAMWRALSVVTGDVVCFLDADSEEFGEHFACGLIGAVALGHEEVRFAKGSYRRPFRLGGELRADGGGRVTELTARPLLQAFYPELAAFGQPLAGELAARRDLLERLPFGTGYSVDIGLLIDAWREVGAAGLAEVDLDVRQNRHRPLSELSSMASAVLAAVTTRLAREGRLDADAPAPLERPPVATLTPAA